MNSDFLVSKEDKKSNMRCSEEKPCYCHGKICLVSDKDSCTSGNVFIEGAAVCGPEKYFTKDLGRTICQQLGFRDLHRIPAKEE